MSASFSEPAVVDKPQSARVEEPALLCIQETTSDGSQAGRNQLPKRASVAGFISTDGALQGRLRDFNLTRNQIGSPNPKVMPSMSRERGKPCELGSCCWHCLCLPQVQPGLRRSQFVPATFCLELACSDQCCPKDRERQTSSRSTKAYLKLVTRRAEDGRSHGIHNALIIQ
jgi:hypothetical protein